MTDVKCCPESPLYQDSITGLILFSALQITDGDCGSYELTYIWGDENTPCPEFCPDCDQLPPASRSERPLPTLFPANNQEIEFYAPLNFTWGKNTKTPSDGFPNEGLQFMGDAGANFKPVRIAIGEKVVNAYLADIIVDGEAARHPQSNRLWRNSIGFEKEAAEGPLLKGEKISTYQCNVVASGPEGKLRTYTVLTQTSLA